MCNIVGVPNGLQSTAGWSEPTSSNMKSAGEWLAGSTARFPLNTINSNFKDTLKFYFYSFIFRHLNFLFEFLVGSLPLTIVLKLTF